jgi:hypothetical protein
VVLNFCVKHLATAGVTAGFSRCDVTRRVDGDALRRPQAYRNRNRMMREWVANQTSGAHYIDFDALAFAPNLPVSVTKHFWSSSLGTALVSTALVLKHGVVICNRCN